MELFDGLKNKAKNKIKRIVRIVAAFLLVACLCIELVYGAGEALVNAVKTWYANATDGTTDFSAMSDEEFAEFMNNPESIYKALTNSGGDGDADTDTSAGEANYKAMGLTLLSYETTKIVFETINEYDSDLDDTYSVQPARRTETASVATSTNIDNITGELEDVKSIKTGLSYGKQKAISIAKSDIENKTDGEDYTSSILAMRWQPIYAALACIAIDQDNNADVDDEQEGYELDEDTVKDVVEFFQWELSEFCSVKDCKGYTFKQFNSKKSAYKMEYYYDADGNRVTVRTAATAPDKLSNGFIRYDYIYEDCTDPYSGELAQICTSRQMTVDGGSFLATMQQFDAYFDLEEFVGILEEMPSTEDLVSLYNNETFTNGTISITTVSADTYSSNGQLIYSSECPSIGVIYHPRNSSSLTGDYDWDDDSQIAIKIYEYSDPSAGTHLYITPAEEGVNYQWYYVNQYALKPGTESDGFTEETLKEFLQGYFSGSDCVLFQSANIDDTVKNFIKWQDDNNYSILFALGILVSEGGLKSSSGTLHYNFWNVKGGTRQFINSNGDAFEDFKAEGYSPGGALVQQLSRLEKFFNRGQINYVQYCWNGYDGLNWQSINSSYCPYYDDTAMPWAEGSTLKGYGGVGGSEETHKGWVGNCASKRYAMEQWARENIDGFTLNPYEVSDDSDPSIFEGIINCLVGE